MVSIMVVAHVPLASALVDCARHVLGHDPYVFAVDILPNESAMDCSKTLSEQIVALDRGDGILLLTDLLGATPCNIATQACHMVQASGVACCVLAGVNASMLLRAINYREGSLEDVATYALAGAAQALLRVD